MDSMENVVTEDQDKMEVKIRNALKECGYPKWSLDRVKQQMNESKKPSKPKKKDNNDQPTRGMVTIPYVEGTAEKIQRIFKKYNIATAMHPTNTLKSLLVHPKDKKDISQCSEVVYDIPCKVCDKSYIGERGRPFGTRMKEHQKDTELEYNQQKIYLGKQKSVNYRIPQIRHHGPHCSRKPCYQLGGGQDSK